jgi:hypothetical protein
MTSKPASPTLSSESPSAIENSVVNDTTPLEVNQDIKTEIEDKPKLTFVVGERCLARWRDNRRFMATINKDLENGKYSTAQSIFAHIQ